MRLVIPSRLKTTLQYLLIIAVTGGLIWFSLRGLTVGEGEDKLDYLILTWSQANKGLLTLMAIIVMLSHLLRAERWRMLLVPSGYKTRLEYSFLSIMVNYLVNLVIPRGGEISRCYNLYKLDKTPVEISFGTVVVERIVDLICLILLISISFILEFEKVFAFIDTIPAKTDGSLRLKGISLLISGPIVLALLLFWLVKKNKKLNRFIRRTWLGFREGLLSVFRLKNKGRFILYSVVIWFFYFVTSYLVILAFPATRHLGLSAVLSLFAIGAIAMAAPLPGGTGSYHVLVPQGLVFLYHIPEADAVAFTFIFHGWQTAITIAGGAISLILTSILVKRKSSRAAGPAM